MRVLLAERPEKVYLTKADLVPDPCERETMANSLRNHGLEPRWISASTGEGISGLLHDLAREFDGQ